MDALLRAIFLPYVGLECTKNDECVILRGPEVQIGGNAVTSLALVLHELATNAAKYGALSSTEGTLGIDWSLENGQLLLKWQERNGPPLDRPPAGEGFGSLLTR